MSRYLKQVIVVRKDLCMPTGKLAAMVAHASMTFLLNRLAARNPPPKVITHIPAYCEDLVLCPLSSDQARWLTELDPGLEDQGQVSMAKIVCQVADEASLLAIEQAAQTAGLTVHRVVDSGHSHNKANTLTCIAIGPHWPEQLEPVTGGLKVYR